MELSSRSEMLGLNRAYACFAFLGAVTLPFGLAALLQKIGVMNFDEGSGGLGERLSGYAYLLGMLLGGPVLIGMLVASVYGIVRTLQFRHTALAVLFVNTIVCGGGTILLIILPDRLDNPMLDYVTGIGFSIYVAANVLIPTWWFLKGRRDYRQATFPTE